MVVGPCATETVTGQRKPEEPAAIDCHVVVAIGRFRFAESALTPTHDLSTGPRCASIAASLGTVFVADEVGVARVVVVVVAGRLWPSAP